MTAKLAFSALSTALLLVACAPADDAGPAQTPRKALPGPPVALETPPPAPDMSTCDAAKAGFAVGQAYSDALAEQARQAAGARVARRLVPGQAITMEFSADRLNLETGDDGRVVGVRCG